MLDRQVPEFRQRNPVIGISFHGRIGDHDHSSVELFQFANDHVQSSNGFRGLHPHQPPQKLLIIRFFVKLPIEPRRGDLKLDLARDDILDVEEAAHLLRDQLAIAERHSTLFVDVDPQEETSPLPVIVDMHQFQPLRRDDLLDLLLHALR